MSLLTQSDDPVLTQHDTNVPVRTTVTTKCTSVSEGVGFGEKKKVRNKGGVGICRGTQPWEGGGTEVS